MVVMVMKEVERATKLLILVAVVAMGKQCGDGGVAVVLRARGVAGG